MDQARHFHHKATLPAILTLLLVTVGLLFYGIYHYTDQTTLPSGSSQSSIGVLLEESSAQRLKQLQKGGISFVYLAASSDTDSEVKLVKQTKLAYGIMVNVDSQKSASQQVAKVEKQVKSFGKLPILLDTGQSDLDAAGLTRLSEMAKLLQAKMPKQEVMVNASRSYVDLMPNGIKFLATSQKTPSRLKYCFWQYTTKGHVAGTGFSHYTMYAYLGTNQQYKQKYGQLTQ
ncbi:hypothetical protein [Lactobacillus sp.]|uniref:hypothetical protein n=1 Tax=Lactobacillus sp. TaxID=1591 RepID=UPI003EF0C2B7